MRLLKHISGCKPKMKMNQEQTEPMDLTSPMKTNVDFSKTVPKLKLQSLNIQPLKITALLRDNAKDPAIEDENDQSFKESMETIKKNDSILDVSVVENVDPNGTEQSLKIKRTRFPFDKDNDEDYMSEFDENDGEEYTNIRRNNKDEVELYSKRNRWHAK